jgi:hypothetical protein
MRSLVRPSELELDKRLRAEARRAEMSSGEVLGVAAAGGVVTTVDAGGASKVTSAALATLAAGLPLANQAARRQHWSAGKVCQ